MTLMAWGALGELIGGIAIIVSLIYVGLQIKQNTDALKLSTVRNTAEDLADLYLVPAQNSELADIFFEACRLSMRWRVLIVCGFTGSSTSSFAPMRMHTINSLAVRWRKIRFGGLQISSFS